MFCEQCVEGRTNRTGMNSKPFKVYFDLLLLPLLSQNCNPKKRKKRKEKKRKQWL
jgi:hypothetical protein